MLTVYAIAQLSFTNKQAYRQYQSQFFEVFQQFEGTLLAADERVSVIEGVWEQDKVILMSFPNRTAFEQWSMSPQYLAIAELRKAGAEGTVLLVNSIED